MGLYKHNYTSIKMSPKKRGSRHRNRRTQSDILISLLRCIPSKKPASINEISKKCKTTWRTTKNNLMALSKAGVIEKVQDRGKKRVKYRKK